jgi:small-conductance mechanosensitive channel
MSKVNKTKMFISRKSSKQIMRIRKLSAYGLRRRVFLLTAFLTLAALVIPIWSGAFGADSSSHSDVLSLLTKTVAWYHQLDTERQIATDPTEIVIVSDNSQIAGEVVRLAFDYARAETANTQTSVQTSTDQNASTSQRVQSLVQLSNKLDSEVSDLQSSLDSLKKKAESASGRQLTELRSTIAETQSELDLAQARRDAVRSMSDFVNHAGPSGLGIGGARAEIESLASTLPPELTTVTGAGKASEATTAKTTPTTPAIKASPSGFWGLIADLFAISRKSRALDQFVTSTDALTESTKQLASGPLSKLRELAQQGDALAKPNTAQDPAALAQEKQNIDAITTQFKQISAVVLPLNKLTIMLGLYRVNLNNWQSTLKTQLRSDLETLLVRATVLALIIGVIFGAGGILRRTIIRYVQEPRRRYQFLLLNRIALWTVVAIIVAFSFASQIGSVATFAGLLTAGLAVALQNVLVSVVGYFFLIGKFGIRVGDRVQISGVNGEVVDVGLVRLQVMEFGGPGSNVPTGRVVAFSNSIVFQTNGLFRQIPGTSFVWHQITLTLAADSDYATVEKRLLGAVEKVFAEYRDKMERQRLQMERTLSFSFPNELKPQSRLQLTSAGIEEVIRFPVDYQDAANVDDQVIRELLKAIEQEPKLKVVAPSTPTLSISEVTAPKTAT